MAMNERKVLVIGATGTVGREAIAAALAQGGRVRALVRSAASAATLDPRVEAVIGDLRDEHAVARALDGVATALYVSPHEPDETALATRFIEACEHAGARLVFIGVHVDGATRLTRWLRRAMYGRMLPHYRPKFAIAERARQSRARPIVLVPTNFFQNDELFHEEIQNGSFPQPFERPVNRVDVRDLGAAAARALLDPSLTSGAYPVIGPESVTGDTCAAAWADALGRDVRCEHDPKRVNAAIARALDGKKRDDFLATYAVLTRFALPTDPAQLAATTALLGRPPTSYAAYVRDAARRQQRAA
jgi:uncharacterized protein YbjT (DUF2867 family)